MLWAHIANISWVIQLLNTVLCNYCITIIICIIVQYYSPYTIGWCTGYIMLCGHIANILCCVQVLNTVLYNDEILRDEIIASYKYA